MPITEELVRDALKNVKYPGFSRDVVSFGLVKGVTIAGSDVTVQMTLATSDPSVPKVIKENSEEALASIPGVGQVRVNIDIQAPAQTAGTAATTIPGVKHVIAIASGKGGVGKSTVAANLAMALSQTNSDVGLCDCDFYGPSIAYMFGSREWPMQSPEGRILPIHQYGLKLMSMGLMLEQNAPVIWRGAKVTQWTQRFLRQVEWGKLDYLILDLPPGTGDIQLTIIQTLALAGAVLVTTPQEVALIDVGKAATMFGELHVPILGVIENMSYFLCPSDQKRYDIFGSGGGAREARRLKVPLLGEIPIDIATREAGDRGRPIVAAADENYVSVEFMKVARHLRDTLPL